MKTKDLGRPSHFLGMGFVWKDDGSLQLRQTKLIQALPESTRMSACKGVSSLATTSFDPSIKGGESIEKFFDYRSVAGSILYLAVKTRPDIAIVASILSQHVESPTTIQYTGAERVLCYLKETMKAALRISPTDDNQLVAFVDSSWEKEPGFGRKSRSGIIIKYASVPVSTAIVLQKFTALSSTEAEYIALSEASRTIVWLRFVLNEFGIEQRPTIFYQHNSGSISWSMENFHSQFSKRKHVDIRCNYIIEKVASKEIFPVKERTENMQTDFFNENTISKKFPVRNYQF